MHKNQKLCTWYFLIVMSFTVLCSLVFLVMNKIERVTSRLEARIYRRNLSYIVDQDYELNKKKDKDEPIEFLNELTDFFYLFHEKTIEFKQQLETFMSKRNRIIYRFNGSNINIYDLTVVPNKQIKEYELRKHIVPIGENPKKYVKQIPFSRQLKFRRNDVTRFESNMFFMCTARIAVSSSVHATLSISFLSTEDNINTNEFMKYRIVKKTLNISMNRIILMSNPKNFRIVIKGYSDKLVKLHKVEAYCMNFNDFTEEEVL